MHAGGGHEPGPTPTPTNLQLEPPMALLSTEKERGLVAEYALEGREAGGVLSEGVLCILCGSSSIDLLGSMPRGNVRVSGSSTQSVRSSEDGSRRTGLP